eukprot:gene5216-6495_t
MARLENPSVAKGLKLFSSRAFAARKRTFLAKKNKVVTPKKAVAAPVKSKEPRTHAANPAEVKGAHKKPSCTKVALRKSIVPGTVLILLAGKFAGKRVVFLSQLPSGLLLVTGPYLLNGVPLRRVNQRYVIATSHKVDVSGVKLPENVNDAYFKVQKKTTQKSEESFFAKDGKKTVVKKATEGRVKDQKAVDAALLQVLKKDQLSTAYLKSKFYLRKGEYPHQMKF